MKKSLVGLTIVALLLALNGCGSGGGGALATSNPTGDYMLGADLVSHGGKRLVRNALYRFTWTPIAAPGATWSRLYIDLLRFDSTGEDTKTTPASVTILNFDKKKMNYLEATCSYGDGTKASRIILINAVPGTVVELEIGLVSWVPTEARDYTWLQFGRVDNVQPPNYRPVGQLTIVDLN